MAVSSNMIPLGTQAPDFSLPDTNGKTVSLADFKDSPVLVVAFICNHCPYVKHIQKTYAAFVKQYQTKGVAFVGISSNDVANYPDDAPDKMADEVDRIGYTFPYLYDETQKVAKAYDAACTPDFYVFDKEQKLVYRGQFDSSRPGSQTPVTGEDMAKVLDALLSGGSVPTEQKPSMGCNIKWKVTKA
jgi:peroxiredoxin